MTLPHTALGFVRDVWAEEAMVIWSKTAFPVKGETRFLLLPTGLKAASRHGLLKLLVFGEEICDSFMMDFLSVGC